VTAVTNFISSQAMYNLTIETDHTYYGNVVDLDAYASSLPAGRSIPEGWTPRIADNGKGVVFQRPGAQGNADMIRIMDPTNKYPDGYIGVYDSHGQPVGTNGKPGPQSATHIPLDGTDPWS
jgi:hypothetical protein